MATDEYVVTVLTDNWFARVAAHVVDVRVTRNGEDIPDDAVEYAIEEDI